MDDDLPFSQASENNKQPILAVLQRYLTEASRVLEIAGGTGQHAVHFAQAFPQLVWQSSDIPEALSTLMPRITRSGLDNLPEPIALNVDGDWPVAARFDAIFSANSLHIMAAESVENFFPGAATSLNSGGYLLVYGPFKYGGDFTTESNARFEQWLKARDPASGIRDFEWVNSLAGEVGLEFVEDSAMPANNQLLVWQKS